MSNNKENYEGSYPSKIKVKCIRCETEYEMPNIGVRPTMQNCPVCRDIDRQMQNILGDLYDSSPTKVIEVEK